MRTLVFDIYDKEGKDLQQRIVIPEDKLGGVSSFYDCGGITIIIDGVKKEINHLYNNHIRIVNAINQWLTDPTILRCNIRVWHYTTFYEIDTQSPTGTITTYTNVEGYTDRWDRKRINIENENEYNEVEKVF